MSRGEVSRHLSKRIPRGRRIDPLLEKSQTPLQAINIDDLAASPWVGLHRHELLLHYRHGLLVQHFLG
jgi:hypothetical protein